MAHPGSDSWGRNKVLPFLSALLSGSGMVFVPGGVPHAAKAGPGGAVALEAFSPPREEFKS